MGCGRIRNLISAYLDQELSGEETLAVRRHLDCCPECAAEYRAFRRVKRLYTALAAVEPPARAGQRVAVARARAWRSSGLRLHTSFLAVPQRVWAAGLGVMSVGLAIAVAVSLLRQPTEPNAVVARTRPAMIAAQDLDPVPALRWSPRPFSISTRSWSTPSGQGPYSRWFEPEARLVSYD